MALVLNSVTSLSAEGNSFKTGQGGNGGTVRNSHSGPGGHSIAVYSLSGNPYTFSNSQFTLGTEGNAGSISGSGTTGTSGRKTNYSWE